VSKSTSDFCVSPEKGVKTLIDAKKEEQLFKLMEGGFISFDRCFRAGGKERDRGIGK
jgi:hypothetical protein